MIKFNQISFFLETIIRRKLKLFIFALAGLFVLILLYSVIFRQFSRPVVSEGFVGVYGEDGLPEDVTNLISSSLVKIDPSGKPAASLAEGWQVNPEGTSYLVKLKKDLYWSDGTELNSSDISLNLADVEVSFPNQQTIRFKLKDSFSPFLSLLNKPVFKKNSHLGTGPYKVDQIKTESKFVKKLSLKPVSDKNLPDVIARFYPNEKIARNGLKVGEVKALFGVTDKSDLIGSNLAEFNKVSENQLVMIFYNTKDAILSDENFRLALSFAAPVVKNEARAKTSFPPTSWAFNDDVKAYLDNSTLSKSYLNKVKNGKDSPVTLTVTGSLKNVGEQVIDAWNKAGIKSVLRVESGIPQNFQALLITQNIPSDPDQYSLWHSTQTRTNIAQISSPRIDKDLEDGRKSTDQEVRKERYLDFQKVLLDRSPATFLYFPKYNVVYFKKIESELKKVLDMQLANI